MVSAPSSFSVRSTAAARSAAEVTVPVSTSALRPSAADPARGFVQPALRGMAEAGDVGAGFGQPDGDRLADAAAGAGHEGDIAVQIE